MTATSLIFSDGSPSFFFADPQTFAIKREVKIKTDKPGDTQGLNELELVDGKLYGNIFQTQTIVRIDPQSGCIEASANMGSLWRSFTDADKKQVSVGGERAQRDRARQGERVVLCDGEAVADDFHRQVRGNKVARLISFRAAASSLSSASA